MINMSDAAIAQVKAMNQGTTIRVGVQGGGCSGLTYKLAFETDPVPETDKSFTREEVTVVTDAKSYLFLEGSTLDYAGGLQGQGFYLSNPNAKRTCGCGDSFSCG